MMNWAQVAVDMAALVAENAQVITIRRGTTTLPSQTVRIARAGGGGGRLVISDGSVEARGRVVVVGNTTFDVQTGDRFNDAAGILYRVVLVRPNRRAAVVAEAEVAQ